VSFTFTPFPRHSNREPATKSQSARRLPDSGRFGSLWFSPLATTTMPLYPWLLGRGYPKLPVITLNLPI
jgi:hypothetical protein